MKIEKVSTFGSATSDGVIRVLVTQTVEGWLITRMVIYGRTRGIIASSASNSIAFEQVRDPNHDLDPDDFCFSNENKPWRDKIAERSGP